MEATQKNHSYGRQNCGLNENITQKGEDYIFGHGKVTVYSVTTNKYIPLTIWAVQNGIKEFRRITAGRPMRQMKAGYIRALIKWHGEFGIVCILNK